MTDLDPKGLEAAAIASAKAAGNFSYADFNAWTRDKYDRIAEAAIRAYLDATDNGWMDISTAPKDGTEVLLWEFDADHAQPRHMHVGWWSDAGGWVRSGDDYDLVVTPTHWLPSPPKPEPQK